MREEDLNPYRSLDGSPSLHLSVTAFLDILGYQQYVASSFAKGNGQAELIRLKQALDKAYENLRNSSKTSGDKRRFEVRAFTDNLVLGKPVFSPHESLGELMSIIMYVAWLQAELAVSGYFIRGGIAVGDLYMDQDLIFGPALMEAYAGEHEIAAFPRVVLCSSARALYESDLWYHGNSFVPDLLIDSDNQVFVDYLEATVMIAYPDDRPFVEFLHGNRQALESKLAEFKATPRIRQKYEWAACYHNSFCEKYPDLFADSDKVSGTLLSSTPRTWRPRTA